MSNDIRTRLINVFTTVTKVAIDQVSQAVERGLQTIEEAATQLVEQTSAKPNASTAKPTATATPAPSKARTRGPARNTGTTPRPSNTHRLSQATIDKIRQGAAMGKTIEGIAEFANVSKSSAARYRNK